MQKILELCKHIQYSLLPIQGMAGGATVRQAVPVCGADHFPFLVQPTVKRSDRRQ